MNINKIMDEPIYSTVTGSPTMAGFEDSRPKTQA